MNLRWDFRSTIGVPVATFGLSLAAVAPCWDKLDHTAFSSEERVTCAVADFKLLNPGQPYVMISGASGTVQQMSIVPSADILGATQAVIDLTQLFMPTFQPLQSQEYLA